MCGLYTGKYGKYNRLADLRTSDKRDLSHLVDLAAKEFIRWKSVLLKFVLNISFISFLEKNDWIQAPGKQQIDAFIDKLLKNDTVFQP